MARMRSSVSRSRSSGPGSVPAPLRRVQVGAVGRQDLGGALLEHVGGGQQGRVLGPGRCGGQDLGRGLGPAAHLGHGGDGHGASIILDRPVKFLISSVGFPARLLNFPARATDQRR